MVVYGHMMYGILLAIFFCLYAMITWRDFVLGVSLFAGLLPVYLLRFSLGPFPSTVLEIMFVILLAVWILQETKQKRLKQSLAAIKQTRFFWPGIALVASAGFSVIWATDYAAALGIFKAYFLEPFILYGILSTRLCSQAAWKKVFIGLGLSAIGLTLFAIVQRVTGLWSPTWEWTLPESRRVTAVYTSPNALGLMLAPVGMLFLAWRFRLEQWSKQLDVYNLAVMFFCISGILLAVSRGAVVAFILSAMVILFLAWSPKKTAALVGLALLLALSLTPVREKAFQLASFQFDSGQSRLALYKGAGDILNTHPITGAGLASFADLFETVRPEGYTEELIYPHNIFLNFWLETSLFGFLSLLWILVICLQIAWKQRHQRNGLFYSWVFLAALLPMLIHGLIDVPYFKNDLAMLTWILLAGLAWSAREGKRQRLICGMSSRT